MVLSVLKLLKLVFLAAVTVGELHRAVVVSVQDRIAELLALLEPTASPLLLLLLLLLLLRWLRWQRRRRWQDQSSMPLQFCWRRHRWWLRPRASVSALLCSRRLFVARLGPRGRCADDLDLCLTALRSSSTVLCSSHPAR